ncbi:MAG: hypothetical protein EP338_09825 [Bacteroidetes bacterium]|nr:MAG: hypothetical protein EP338_09825 [Bacteroidota bacterium]
MKDIRTKEDISLLVNDFYGKVLKNESLVPFFQKLNFEKHMPKNQSMFRNTNLFGNDDPIFIPLKK